MNRLLLVSVLIVIEALGAIANAETVKNIRSKILEPIAPRGGILMLPLTAERHGDQWPQTMELRTKEGRKIIGQIAWLLPAEPKLHRSWTDDPRDLLIRPGQPHDDSAALADDPVLGPYLLALLPKDMQGSLRLGKQALNPTWCDIPGTPLPSQVTDDRFDPDRSALELVPSPDRPDPVSVFEYWRWVLLADRMELLAPTPFGSEVERMAAAHYAALWRIGLQRLKNASPRLAQQCIEMLTKTGIDRRQTFAAWVADPLEVSALLAVLLDFRRSNAQVLSHVVEWIDRQSPLYVWPELEYGPQVRLALITPGSDPLVVEFQWQHSGESPVAVRLEPAVLMQVTLDRPALPQPPIIGMAPPPEPTQQVLLIKAGGRQFEMTFGPRVIVAQPPGVFFRPLVGPLTLADVQMRRVRLPAREHATQVQLRRLEGRWEVFFECRRQLPGDDPLPEQIVPEFMRSFNDLRGIEAATLILGASEHDHAARIWLTIPESGLWRLLAGSNDGTLQIHRRSYKDRWLCRVVLPESWIVQSDVSSIAFIRSRYDSVQLECGPSASTPWRPEPGRVAIDTTRWDDLPSSQSESQAASEVAAGAQKR